MSAQLVVHFQGQEHTTIELDESREYFVGRGSTSDVVLKHEKGISRQHLRIYFDGGWAVELLSRFGGLSFEGQMCERIQLNASLQFSLSDFIFNFKLNDVAEPAHESFDSSELESENYDEAAETQDLSLIHISEPTRPY